MQLQKIHQKNILLERILWICFVLCILVQVLKQKDHILLLILFFCGFLICSMITFLIRKKIFIEQTMYICALSMAAFTFILLYNEPVIGNMYLVFLVIFILTLYQDYRPVLLMTLVSVFIGLYFYSNGSQLNYTYQNGDYLYFLFTLTVTLVVALLQIRFSKEVKKEEDLEKRRVIEENERQLRTLIHSMPDLIYVKDGEGRFTIMNEYSKGFFGLLETEYKMKSSNELEKLNSNFANIYKPFNNDEETWNKGCLHRFELLTSSLKGEQNWFDVIKVPTFHDNGKRKSLLVIARDITEQKNTNEYLLKSEKLNVVGELAAGVAHEVRNPLTSIKGFLQLFLSQDKYNDGYLNIMLDEISRIELIISEYLSIAKPNHDEGNYKLQDIKPILTNVVTLFMAQANAKNVIIHTDFEDQCTTICNIQELKQVFINIIQNALEATKVNSKIAIVMKRNADKISISVQDQGCGIPENRLAKLGEPFYSTKEKGTGLGLMTCFRIIEKHNGKMTFDSVVGIGTTVNIELDYEGQL